jgi:ABC-type transporter Mla subunit MlaD
VLDVTPKYIAAIPANVSASVKATTVFGNKYVAFTSPKSPAGTIDHTVNYVWGRQLGDFTTNP